MNVPGPRFSPYFSRTKWGVGVGIDSLKRGGIVKKKKRGNRWEIDAYIKEMAHP